MSRIRSVRCTHPCSSTMLTSYVITVPLMVLDSPRIKDPELADSSFGLSRRSFPTAVRFDQRLDGLVPGQVDTGARVAWDRVVQRGAESGVATRRTTPRLQHQWTSNQRPHRRDK